MQYKLTQREKMLLFGLAIFSFLSVGYMYLISPALNKRLTLQDALLTEQDKKFSMEQSIQQLPQLKEQQEQARQRAIEAGKLFYQPLNTNQATELVTALTDLHGLVATDMSISGLSVKDLSSGELSEITTYGYTWGNQIQAAQQAEGNTSDDQTTPNTTGGDTAQVLSCLVSMTCTGEEAALQDFFTDLADRVPVRLMTFDSSQMGNWSITLELYMLDAIQ